MTDAPSFVKASDAQASPDKLDAVRSAARRARDLELDIIDLEARLEKAKKDLNRVTREELPDLLDQANMFIIGIDAEGNFPAYEIELKPFYSANIAADWPEEKRRAAFSALTELGHEDLIKTVISTAFPRKDRKDAIIFAEKVKGMGLEPEMKESVHNQTLTAWLKEQVEGHKPIPPLDVIGGFVGRIAKLKERKE